MDELCELSCFQTGGTAPTALLHRNTLELKDDVWKDEAGALAYFCHPTRRINTIPLLPQGDQQLASP